LELTDRQRDSLSELINIGYCRAAASLSDLLNQRIVLNTPTVEVFSVERVGAALRYVLGPEAASVHQVFSGQVSGHALLLLDAAAFDQLSSFLIEDDLTGEERRSAARDALCEVGNIVLQASLGVCGSLLQVHIAFSVPRLHLESVDDILNSLTIDNQELQFALFVRTRFELSRNRITGYLVVILGVTSFSRLLTELEGWETRATKRN
jgi:chemotaxis protein CheC